jgi:ESS family glutamate:Na+ symporter
METTIIDGLYLIKLDLFVSVALGAAVYYLGVFLRSRFPLLVKLSIPAPAIGGLLVCGLIWLLRARCGVEVRFDGTLQTFFMIIFFCTVGMNASYKLVIKGGLLIISFWAVSTILAIVQNMAGISVARLFSLDPLMGIIGGSVTMTGGLGTAGAFGPMFEETYGVTGATTAAIACATFGMIAGSLLGGPLGEFIIKTNKVVTPNTKFAPKTDIQSNIEEEEVTVTDTHLMHNLAWLLLALGAGSILSGFVKNAGITIPNYLCGMLIAIIIRNIGDVTHLYHIDTKTVGVIGDISLSIFVTMAINSMQLWQIVGLALPLVVMMIVQMILILLFAYFIVFLLFGRNYDSTVIASGLIGFGMGATPNALICMQAITGKYGMSPKAFFVVPIVGSFLLDITNAAIITLQAAMLK